MVERDYLMRIIQEFFEAMAKAINLKSTLKGEYPDYSVIQEKYNEMYERFLQKPPGYYYETDKETILDNLVNERYSERDMLAKMQMVAELLFQDGLIKGYTQKNDLLEKSLYLFDYIECKSNTYSWERDQRKIDIKKILY